MNHLFDITFSWTNMLWLIAMLGLIYFGLILTRRLLKEWGPASWKSGHLINSLLIPFELSAFVLVIAAFIWINPARHAIIALVIFSLGFKPLKNYFSGRVLLAFRDLKVGQRIESLQNKGIIKDISRYGIQLSTSKGIQFLDYTQYNVRLMVREENHLQELISMLEESGFKCKISKK